jgi:hypothetical protein
MRSLSSYLKIGQRSQRPSNEKKAGSWPREIKKPQQCGMKSSRGSITWIFIEKTFCALVGIEKPQLRWGTCWSSPKHNERYSRIAEPGSDNGLGGQPVQLQTR